MIEFKNEVYDLEMSFERKLLHESLDEAVNEYYDGIEMDDDAEEEYQAAHDMISAKDESGLDGFLIGMSDISFSKLAKNELLKEALELAGYKVEKSHMSSSHYIINNEGKEVRVSDHKRPAVADASGIYHDHEYELEFIIDGTTVASSQLKEYGIELKEGKYYLG
jgi:hypothetical protein